MDAHQAVMCAKYYLVTCIVTRIKNEENKKGFINFHKKKAVSHLSNIFGALEIHLVNYTMGDNSVSLTLFGIDE